MSTALLYTNSKATLERDHVWNLIYNSMVGKKICWVKHKLKQEAKFLSFKKLSVWGRLGGHRQWHQNLSVLHVLAFGDPILFG